MKQFLLIWMVCFYGGHVFSQRTASLKPASSVNEAWGLSKYVWSHTHPVSDWGGKPILDFEALDNWTGIENGNDRDLAISADGKYIGYTIQKSHTGKRHRLVVQSVTGDWRQDFTGGEPGFFSGGGKMYVFKDKGGLRFLGLGGNNSHMIKSVESYKTPADGKNEWVAYQVKDSSNMVVLQNLLTGKEQQMPGATDYEFDKSGQWLVCWLAKDKKELAVINLHTGAAERFGSIGGYLFDTGGKTMLIKMARDAAGNGATGLEVLDPANGKRRTIWSTTNKNLVIGSYVFDASGRQVIFVLQDTSQAGGMASKFRSSVWYWKEGMDQVERKVDEQTEGIDQKLYIQSADFSDNGNYVVLKLRRRPENLQVNPEGIKVDVWSYKDTVIQSSQPYLNEEAARRSYRAVFNLAAGRITYCDQDYEYLQIIRGNYGMIERNGRDKIMGDRFWEEGYNQGRYTLISLKDGSHPFKFNAWLNGGGLGRWIVSPDGRYWVYFDAEKQGNYYSFDSKTGKVAKISEGVPAWQLGYVYEYHLPHERPRRPVGIGGWLLEGGSLIVYDNYDVWQLDLSGKRPAVNLTNGYGRKNHIVLRLAGEPQQALIGKNRLLLKAFNRQNKYNGFFQKQLGVKSNPELLYMSPCFITGDIANLVGMEPLKAEETDLWIVKRQTATESPNYYMTRDFKCFQSITDLHPEKKYNWLKAELHNFKQLDGTTSQGLLYKPENFDPSKKYPIIIYWYFQLSQNFNQYYAPDFIISPSIEEGSIVWMVNHGYLVFQPDVYFTKNKWGPSVMNTVEGAVKYLQRLPYVDGNHIGATGHSNSGRTAYYVLTHSKSFAAISVGASMTDVISLSLSLNLDGPGRNPSSKQEWVEAGGYGTQLGNLWQNKSSWLDHTAVLNADSVVSPVLLFDNKNDEAYSAGKAIEMFLALRRLEKSAWWLQYDKGGHVVFQKERNDLTIRYMQFFDHYLKGTPAPRWMTQGIPAKLKGIESRFELDPSGTCDLPNKKECNICAAWNKQYQRSPAMFEKPISEWKLDDDIQKELDKKETERYRKNMVGEAQRIKENNAKLKQKVKE